MCRGARHECARIFCGKDSIGHWARLRTMLGTGIGNWGRSSLLTQTEILQAMARAGLNFLRRSCEAQSDAQPVHARAVFSGNSKPTFPLSNFRYAENGRPRFEMKPSSKSVLPVASSFFICSRSIDRWRMTLPDRKSHVLFGPTEFSQT